MTCVMQSEARNQKAVVWEGGTVNIQDMQQLGDTGSGGAQREEPQTRDNKQYRIQYIKNICLKKLTT
jgi:hypothetical protein